MFHKTTVALVIAVVPSIAACKEKKEADNPPVQAAPTAPPPAPEPAAAPTPAPTPTPVLTLEAAKLKVERSKKAKKNPDDFDELALETSGDVKAGTKVVAKVTPEGKLTDPTGKTLATMAANGDVTFEGESETLTIAEDGTITRAGKELVKIGPDGVFSGDMTKEMSEKVTFEGSPGARRAMMFAFVGAIASSEPSAAPPPAGAKKEPATK